MWKSTMTTTSSEDAFPSLSSAEDQRVWALGKAKRILIRKPFGGDEISTIDLIDLSKFILSGEDPYAKGNTK